MLFNYSQAQKEKQHSPAALNVLFHLFFDIGRGAT
jgi:hypothetical protein